MRNVKRWLIVPLAAVALVTVGTWAYIRFVHGDALERLTLGGAEPTPSADADRAAGVGGAEDARAGALDGMWATTAASQAGYRVKEILFGQEAEAVGRTNAVTGRVEIRGTTVTAASFEVDLTTVASDNSRRDNQFRGRIMDVARFPTAAFRLTSPIDVAPLPPDGEQVHETAVGDLTLRGTTRRVNVDVRARRAGETIEIAGTIPVLFADWGIPDPSFGPAQTEDRGEIEFLLVLTRAR
jgi:polyisoprenoid-binding protein YceI